MVPRSANLPDYYAEAQEHFRYGACMYVLMADNLAMPFDESLWTLNKIIG